MVTGRKMNDTGMIVGAHAYTPRDQALSQAAVLAPLYHDRGTWRLLLIRRSDTVAHHRGQYAFPGGRREPQDRHPWDTALREAREELGWGLTQVRLLAVLPLQITATTGFCIHPFLGETGWPLELRPSRDEVSHIITPALAFFKENHHQSLATPALDGSPCYHYGSCRIWGATARIIHRLVATLMTP